MTHWIAKAAIVALLWILAGCLVWVFIYGATKNDVEP